MTRHDHQEIVLIVEDDVETAKALAEFLSLEGFDSIIVENGQEAMAMLRTGRFMASYFERARILT